MQKLHKFYIWLTYFILTIGIATSCIFGVSGCQYETDETMAKKERITRNIDKLEPLLGYWQTPPTGGSARIRYLYLAPNMKAEKGEIFAQSRYGEADWEVDDITDDGRVYFSVVYPNNQKSYIYTLTDDKITSDDEHLVDVIDGKTQLPFYMTRCEKPEGIDEWGNKIK